MKRTAVLLQIGLLAVTLWGATDSSRIINDPVLQGKIQYYLAMAGVRLEGVVTMTCIPEVLDGPVIMVKDSGTGNTYRVALFELSFTSTRIIRTDPIISYGGLTYKGYTDHLYLDTSEGDLSSMMDKNSYTGPFFVSPEGGRHNGLLNMYVQLTYPEPRSFESISLTPFFRQTGSDGALANPAYQRLVVTNVLVDGKPIAGFEGNAVCTNVFGPGPLAPQHPGAWRLGGDELTGPYRWLHPEMVFTHQSKRTFSIPKTTGTKLRIEMENPYRSDHDTGGDDTFSLGIREIAIK